MINSVTMELSEVTSPNALLPILDRTGMGHNLATSAAAVGSLVISCTCGYTLQVEGHFQDFRVCCPLIVQ